MKKKLTEWFGFILLVSAVFIATGKLPINGQFVPMEYSTPLLVIGLILATGVYKK